MRFAAVTLAYNDEGVIAGTLRCLKPYIEKHIVLISEKPYFGEAQPSDRTEEICEELGAYVVKGQWKLDHFQRTLGNQLCSDVDWVFTFDSDEMMTAKDIGKLINIMEKTDAEALCVKPIVYWKDINHVLSPRPGYEPVIATRPWVRFPYIRNIDRNPLSVDVDMHHLSWCSPKDIYKKVMNYAHATDFDGESWYKENYENWGIFSKKAILPTEVFNVEYSPLPEELRCYLR